MMKPFVLESNLGSAERAGGASHYYIAVRDGGTFARWTSAIRYAAIIFGYRQEATFIADNISIIVLEILPLSRENMPNVPRNRAISTFSRKRVVGGPGLEI